MSNAENGRRQVGSLLVDRGFFDFVEKELLPAIAVEPATFWSGFEALIDELTPVNRALLKTRDELQEQIDDWHRAHPGDNYDHAEYVAFLRSIGYLLEPGADYRTEDTGETADGCPLVAVCHGSAGCLDDS